MIIVILLYNKMNIEKEILNREEINLIEFLIGIFKKSHCF
jgi:hypothetical protein